jgi:hypothetical protein
MRLFIIYYSTYIKFKIVKIAATVGEEGGRGSQKGVKFGRRI